MYGLRHQTGKSDIPGDKMTHIPRERYVAFRITLQDYLFQITNLKFHIRQEHRDSTILQEHMQSLRCALQGLLGLCQGFTIMRIFHLKWAFDFGWINQAVYATF